MPNFHLAIPGNQLLNCLDWHCVAQVWAETLEVAESLLGITEPKQYA